MVQTTPDGNQSLALLSDLYELTMAYGYWKLGRAHERAVFTMEFREHPFAGGYAIAAGLAAVIEFLDGLRFTEDDLDYLAGLKGAGDRPLFERGFLDYLRDLRFACSVEAVPEGTAVFAHEPLLRVEGPLLQAQILETPLLNLMNFQTLIASKAARVCLAAEGDPVIEFGLRRAQGIDGGVSASRAAYVGGCVGTSNVLAGKRFGIPVKGTHAHSWVMSFATEGESFEKWAEVMPHNSIFLVDTYRTLDGVRNAAKVGQAMAQQGKAMMGIRLDSGDLAYLSQQARRILDAHGLHEAKILASGDLDEHVIASLKRQEARIDVWGVGTHLTTAYDQPALGGVYKLGAIYDEQASQWRSTVKLSEQAVKVNAPGLLRVKRFWQDGLLMADMIYDQRHDPIAAGRPATIIHPADPTRRRELSPNDRHEELLVRIYEHGRRVYDPPALEHARQRTLDQLEALDPAIKRFLNPHEYPVGLERWLYDLKTRLIMEARGPA